MDVKYVDHCLACGSTKLKLALDLGQQPLANSYTAAPESQQHYPLAINLCENCFHIQLTHIVDPEIIYKNYLYTTGTSKTMQDYSRWFADFSLKYFYTQPHSVLDIGCNDGTQLDYYKQLGCKTFGIDPAENLSLNSSKNHNIIVDFFSPEVLPKVKDKFDLIVAQNVFAHNPNPVDFLKTCREILTDNGLLFIQTSQANMIVNKEFDTIYHEHINFFNSYSMKLACERSGLYLIDVIKTPVHGTSYIFIVSKKASTDIRVEDRIIEETDQGLFSLDTYDRWRYFVETNINLLKDRILEYKEQGYKIIGYGAAAKGNTLLNYKQIQLDYIVDDNKLKQNFFTPGMNIPILSPDTLANESSDRILFLPLAWNFFDEIKEKILSKRNNRMDKFIRYFPEVLIHV